MINYFMRLVAYLLVPVTSYGITLTPPDKAVPLVFFGIHNIRFHDSRMQVGINAGSIRLWDAGTAWVHLEPQKGTWDFRRLDLAVKNAKARNQDIILTLGRPPQWASSKPNERSFYGPGEAAPPRSINDFERYVETVAQRYNGDIRHFEVWNEPASSGMFSGTTLQMVELTLTAKRAINKVSGDNKLVCPSPAKFESLQWFDYFASVGGLSHCDIIGYHFYTDHPLPEKRIALFNSLKQIVDKHGESRKPIWDTESGTDTFEASNKLNISRSAYLARWLIITWALGIERFYWYAWDHDRLGFVSPTTGSLRSDLKRSHEIVQKWMLGNKFSSCSVESSLWQCNLFLSDGGKATIVWSELSDGAVSYSIEGAKLIEDISGFSAKPSVLSITLTASPVLVVW